MFWVKIEDFEAICYNFAKELFDFSQPIPPFVTRYQGILESCLATPLQQVSGKDLYPTFEHKLAMLFYLMIKNHPFLNGNKRLAIATLLVTLYGNKKWIKAEQLKAYEFAIRVSASKPDEKDSTLRAIRKFISNSITELKES